MTIPEATEQLTLLDKHPLPDLSRDERAAIKLGIEALKRVQKMRTYKPTPPGMPLPGETGD